MPHRYAELTFTPDVLAMQTHYGAAQDMARYRDDNGPFDRLSETEANFIARRDSFYQASVSETGWPYLQRLPESARCQADGLRGFSRQSPVHLGRQSGGQ